MLHRRLARYLTKVETAIKGLNDAYVEQYIEEILTPKRINLRIRLRFANGHLLELNEAVIVKKGEIEHLSYRYHLQEKENILVFRYDNAPHFPDLDNCPHHKHIPGKVVGNKKISILKAIKEASLFIKRAGPAGKDS